jgi:hypothetical protein
VELPYEVSSEKEGASSQDAIKAEERQKYFKEILTKD